MRNRRPSPDHAEAVARRLALLEAELDAARRSSTTSPGEVRVPGAVTSPVTRVPEALSAREGRSAAVDVDEWEALDPADVAWVDLGDEPSAETATPRVTAGVPVHPVTESERTGDAAVPLVPDPGRHARRRGVQRRPAELLEALPVDLRLTPAHLTVVATVVVVALGVTCWWLLAGRVEPSMSPVAAPVRTMQPGEEPSAAPAASDRTAGAAPAGKQTSAAGATPPAAAAEIVVDVAGKVRRPGIVVLPAGSRVVDAIEAAGGARRGVDLSPLNLARPLNDGEQVLVGVTAPPQGTSAPTGGGQAGAAGAGGSQPVNINLASLQELDTLPGVGPVTAQAIIDWRTRHGGFTAVDDLLEVDGIGPATLARLAPHVTL